jgi:uncharacterized membrane protein (DUF441 family)
MKALLTGIVIIAAAVLAAIPQGLGWWPDILVFLRGGVPILACIIGLVAVFIGAADIKDRADAKAGAKNDGKEDTSPAPDR